MERRKSWDKALAVLQEKALNKTLTSKERTLMKVLDVRNPPLYIAGFLEDCSDFEILVRDLTQ